MSAPGSALLGVALASAGATLVLARLAPRLGWTDPPREARKLQRRAVPAVGGAAILGALALAPREWWCAAPLELWGPWLPAPGWRLAALALVFALGTLDDRRPLAPLPKALGQLAALAPLALGTLIEAGPIPALALWLLAGLALNLLNTFDNADGALAGLCALGFAGPAPLLAAACLGFLPLNLDAWRAANRASAAPSAYLGDAGAFVLGLFVVFVPASAGVLFLPALDLARLARVRWRANSRPWLGDRRHLAHRLAARGLSPAAVAALTTLIALPGCLWGSRALATGTLWPALAGPAGTTLLFAMALRWAREPRPRA
jgi:UDP-N-acetylmuramyl pentapeptide phosphotransferase/UDP-N-acetylglucosamine-1-phosphate transferase